MKNDSPKIEAEKSLLENEVNQLVYIKLKEQQKPVSINQLVQSSGLPIFKVETALNDFMKVYNCRLSVNEDGELLYNFRLTWPPKTSKSIVERIAALIAFFFKLWITLMVYTLGIIYAVLLAFIGGDGSLVLAAVFLALISPIILLVDIVKYMIGKGKNTMLQGIFNYVFGEEEKERDKFEEEKRVLEWLRHNQYKITTTDLVMLTGWSLDKAEEEIVHILSNYQGEVYVTEQGIIIYSFPNLKTESTTTEEQKTPDKLLFSFVWWNLPKSRKWVSYNEISSTIILCIIGLNLIVSIITSAYADLSDPQFWGIQNLLEFDFYNSFWTTYFLFAFSTLFFAIPIIGKIFFNSKIVDREQEIIYLKTMGFLFSFLQNIPKPNNLLEPYFKQLRVNLAGEFVNDEDGRILMHFRRMEAELEAVKTERGEGATDWLKELRDLQAESKYRGGLEFRKAQKKHCQYLFKDFRKSKFKIFHLIFQFLLLVGLMLGGFIAGPQVVENFKSVEMKHYENLLKNPLAVKRLELENSFMQMPRNIGEFKNLKYLKIAKNHYLPTIVEQVGQLKQLDSLIIEDNHSLAEFKEGAFDLPNLRYLKIENVQGGTLPDLSKATKLEYLDFRKTSYSSTSLPKSVGELQNLKSLDLTDNHMEELPAGVWQLKQLQSLSLNKTYPDKIPETISNLTELTFLGLARYRGEPLPKALFSLPKLRHLILSDAYLSGGLQLVDFAKLEALESLNIYSLEFEGGGKPTWEQIEELQKLKPDLEINHSIKKPETEQ